MDVIWKLTIQQLKHKKKRTLSIFSGIAAASFLLTIAITFISSVLHKMSDLTMIVDEYQKLIVGAGILMAAILASLTLFIYHILSVSAAERIRQLGILGSVGATPFQRIKLMLLETFILSMIGLPVGLFLGVMTARLAFPFTVVISWKTLLLFLGFEGMTIILTGFLHACLSMRRNVLELLLNRTEKRKLTKNWKAPRWVGKLFGIEGEMSAKNIYFFRRRYAVIALSFIATMVLFLDGFLYLNYMDGKYEPTDPCVKQYADFVLEKNGEKELKNWQLFVEEVSGMSEIEEAVAMQELKLGEVLFKEANIKKDLKTFTVFASDGSYENPVVLNRNTANEREGYYIGLTLIGIDDAAFARYEKQLGVTAKKKESENGLPVIIYDTLFVKKDRQTKYRPILNLKEGENFSVLADRNRTAYGDSYSVKEIEEFSEYQFHTVTVTEELPSCYNIAVEQMRYPNDILFFTPQSCLDEFLQICEQPNITETWNHLNTFDESEGWQTTQFLCLNIKNKAELPLQILSPQVITTIDSWQKTFKLNDEYVNTRKGEKLRSLLKKYEEQLRLVHGKITDVGEKYNLINPDNIDIEDEQWYKKHDYVISHYLGWIWGALSDPLPALRHLFTYTLLTFLLIMGTFQMIKMIVSTTATRRREFAVMLSLGMEPMDIRKMVCMESVFCLLISYIIGSIVSVVIGFSLFQHWSQLQAIEFHFPYRLLVMEFLFLIFMIMLMSYISVKSVRKIEIADLLKDDTL